MKAVMQLLYRIDREWYQTNCTNVTAALPDGV